MKHAEYTFHDYTTERLKAQKSKRSFKDGLAYAGLGICGEAGEVAEHIKKHLHHGKPLKVSAVAKELGDVLWYVMYTADVIGYSLEEIAALNNKKLRQRYPEGFTVLAASKVRSSR